MGLFINNYMFTTGLLLLRGNCPKIVTHNLVDIDYTPLPLLIIDRQ